MKLKTFYLNFTAPLHLGNYKPEGYEQSEVFLRSDTIVAAVMSAWALAGKEKWIEEYKQNNAFVLSSAFPFVKDENGQIIHFFPRPKLRLNIDYNNNKDNNEKDRCKDSSPGFRKKIKKITWLDSHYFEGIIANKKLDEDREAFESDLQDEFLSRRRWKSDVFSREIQERVKIPRDISKQKDSQPFYMERIRFGDNAGLYFMADGNMINKLKTGLEILQHEGFGTDRAVGNGYFLLTEGTIELKIPPDSGYMTNLGLFCPENKEQLSEFIDDNSAFSIIKRGGWVTIPNFTGLRKNNIYMFEEGSVFKNNQKSAGKKQINLTPEIMKNSGIEILRNGRTFFVPVNHEL